MIETETVDCDLCGGGGRAVVFERDDDGVRSTVVRCETCGLLSTSPRLTERAIVPLYQRDYAEGPPRRPGALRRLVVERPLPRLIWHRLAGNCLGEFLGEARGKLLDVGCGTGDLLADAAARGCEPHGVEFNPDSVVRARARGLDVRSGGLDAAGFADSSFDTIVFWHSLEHLPSPKAALATARRLLRPGGRVFVYLPNARSYLAAWLGPAWYGWQLPFHFYHYTPETLRALAEASGLSVAALKTVTAEFVLPHSLVRRFGSRVFASRVFRATSIPALRVLDLLMPDRGEFIFAELSTRGQAPS